MKPYLNVLIRVAAAGSLFLGRGSMSAAAPGAMPAAEERVTVRPADTGAALENPGMGWVLHFYDNTITNYGGRLAPSDTVDDYPGLTVAYLRLPWALVEPEEGKFNWSVVDTPAQRWLAKGKQIAFRFSCSESWMPYATPEWVRKAGAKGHNFKPGQGIVADGPFWEPDFDDPVFLEKLDHFLAAAAARYDGDPNVAFIDVGSFGVWGEGHTYWSTKLPYSTETLKRHIDLHLKHFKHTLLAANDDFASHGRGKEIIDYARDHGLTLRDDSILVQPGKNAYFSAGMAPDFWPRVPVILESEHYGGSRDKGYWGDGSLYLQAVEDYHASYASIHWWPREFLTEMRPLIDKMNLRLGYRLQLVDASWPAAMRLGATWRLHASWRNAGVAPCLPGGYPAITLKDARGGIAGVFVDPTFDMRALAVGAPGQAQTRAQEASFTLPFNLNAGTYQVYVSVGTLTGTPRLALPLGGDDGRRRYLLGTLKVTGDYALRMGALEQRGEKWLFPLTYEIHRALPAGAAPFCHFEGEDGKIAFFAEPEPGQKLAGLSQPGTLSLSYSFRVPDSARGKRFSLRVGLWQPERIGKPDERLTPDNGESDRRVVLGTLLVKEDGGVTLQAAR